MASHRKFAIVGAWSVLVWLALTSGVVRAQQSSDATVNPKVAPGKVRWHGTFAEACAAAQKSRKPVFLFQLLGKLDDQFC